MIANKLQVSCGSDKWLQINYKFHVKLIINCKLITNSIGIDN